MAKLKRAGCTPVSEGVRIEMGHYTVFAVRNAEKDISVRVRREPRGFLRGSMRIPFIRGIVRLLRDIVRFFSGLNESAELDPLKPECGTPPERLLARLLHVHPQTIVAWTSALLVPVIACLALYAAPEGVELFLRENASMTRAAIAVFVCAARVLGLFAGVLLVGRLRVFRRLLMYKGAFNKVLNCYECREPIAPSSVARYSTLTRRSEPAFLILVAALSIIVFALLPPLSPAIRMIVRLLVVLIVAAVLNEPLAAIEAAKPSTAIRILRAPIDFLQHITVLEPQKQMLEVAICAFEAALGETDEEVKTD